MIDRRFFLLLFFMASTLGPFLARAAELPINLQWDDLIPQNKSGESPFGLVLHGELGTPVPEESSADFTSAYNGKIVRIPGFVVPLDFEGSTTKEFLLVPYFGACIHVPPPPANQIIIVRTSKPYKFDELFEAVYVTGMFGTAATATQFADVGYAMSAEKIEPYE